MITVHHLNNSRSQRVLWMLEEMEFPYEVRRYERDAETMLAPEAMRAVHPLGKSPIITDGVLTLPETGAIVEYLAQKPAGERLLPARGTREHLQCTYWVHYAEGSAMTPLLLKLVFDRIETQPVPFIVKPVVRAICDRVTSAFIGPQLKLHLDYMESELARSPWFAGPNLTIADIMMSFPLEVAASRGGLDAGRPSLWRFLETIHARPAYRRALEKGGPYEVV